MNVKPERTFKRLLWRASSDKVLVKDGMLPYSCWLAVVKILSSDARRRPSGNGPIKPVLDPGTPERSSTAKSESKVLDSGPSNKL